MEDYFGDARIYEQAQRSLDVAISLDNYRLNRGEESNFADLMQYSNFLDSAATLIDREEMVGTDLHLLFGELVGGYFDYLSEPEGLKREDVVEGLRMTADELRRFRDVSEDGLVDLIHFCCQGSEVFERYIWRHAEPSYLAA